MKIAFEKLAELTGSTIAGDKLIQVNSVATLGEAVKGQISFLSNPKYFSLLGKSKASVVILSPKHAQDYVGNALINEDPYLTYAKVLEVLYVEENLEFLIHPSAVIFKETTINEKVSIGANVVIEAGVKIDEGVVIGAGSYIGQNSTLGRNTWIKPNVTIYADTQIGNNTIIHSGAVIGADGFGFAPQKDKSWHKLLQIGNVVIGNDVEIGANTTIDRAALGSTTIANGVKLDNQIQVGHNVQIGENTVVAAGTGFAGSCIIGKRCQIAGDAGIAGHLEIADDVIITGKSMVTKSISKPGVYSSGWTVDENKKWNRNQARFRQLDEIVKKLNQFEKKLNEK